MPQVNPKRCAIAYHIQTGKSVYGAAGTQVVIPLPAGEGLDWNPNYEDINFTDARQWRACFFSGGEWLTGDLQVPLTPGYCVDLFDWVITSDADWQGKWATVWRDLSATSGQYEKYGDVKVASASGTLAAGRLPEMTLTLLGRVQLTGEAIGQAAPIACPYEPKEVAISLDPDGASPAVTGICKQVTFNINRMVEDGADGMRLNGYAYPATLDNFGGIEVDGELTAEFSSEADAIALYDACQAQNEGSMTVTMTHAPNTATLAFKRMVWQTKTPVKIPAAGGFTSITVPFKCYGSLNGATAPMTMAEA